MKRYPDFTPLSMLGNINMSTVLVITQVYIPDPASVGQHLHDVSRELVKQGKRVVVFTPSGGYDEPSGDI